MLSQHYNCLNVITYIESHALIFGSFFFCIRSILSHLKSKFRQPYTAFDLLCYLFFLSQSWLKLMDQASGETDVSQIMFNLESQHRYLKWRAEKVGSPFCYLKIHAFYPREFLIKIWKPGSRPSTSKKIGWGDSCKGTNILWLSIKLVCVRLRLQHKIISVDCLIAL